MCFAPDARPPDLPADLALPPLAGGAAAELLELTSADGARFSAALCLLGPEGGAGVVVLPDIRGLSPFYVELAERFADAGHHAIALDPFGRTAGTGVRGEGFDHLPHVLQTRVGQVQADAIAAREALVPAHRRGERRRRRVLLRRDAGLPERPRARDSASTATVGFYGILAGGRSGAPPGARPRRRAARTAPRALRRAPTAPSRSSRSQALDRGLADAGVEHEVVLYPGAPHSFFDRSAAEHAEASQDAWRRVLGFLDQVAGIAR